MERITASTIRNLPKPDFIDWLVHESDIEIHGVETECYRLEAEIDEGKLESWALHFRRHYLRDDELETLSEAAGKTPTQYLQDDIVPSIPQIRSGDFAEIVISDLLQFVASYSVPRYKQRGRVDKDKSGFGVDIIAYKVSDSKSPMPTDELMTVEVKARCSDTNLKKALVDAGKDSAKDKSRVGMTMNFIMMRSYSDGDIRTFEDMARLMKKSEHPYVERSAAAAVVAVIDADKHLDDATASDLFLEANDMVFIVHGARLMELVHQLYDRCIK